jgi:hypothetical protein
MNFSKYGFSAKISHYLLFSTKKAGKTQQPLDFSFFALFLRPGLPSTSDSLTSSSSSSSSSSFSSAYC